MTPSLSEASQPARRRALLVYTSTDWPGSLRAAEGLSAAGFTVYALCPTDHLVTYTRHVNEWAAYRAPIDAAAFGATLVALIDRWAPDLLLPADDAALWLLHRLRLDPAVADASPALAATLARSVGRAERLLVLEKKSHLPEVARALDIAVPDTCVDPTPEEAEAFAAAHGWPVVLKHDYTWGGLGVRFAHTPDALRALLAWRPDVASIAPRSVSLSRCVAGVACMVSYAAWEGRLLGCLPFEKVRATGGGGAAVVKRADDACVEAVRRLVSHFGLTGLGDVEFIVDARTGVPQVLEINPRIVPTSHLGSRFGVDLCGLLRDAVDGQVGDAQVASTPVGRDGRPLHVALFPFEWLRDGSSVHLWSDAHDVPWDDPRLLCEMVRRFAPAPDQ